MGTTKRKIIVIACVLAFWAVCAVGVIEIIKSLGKSEYTLVDAGGFERKVTQWNETLGFVERDIPIVTSSEGMSARYPTYGTSISGITDAEKSGLIEECKVIFTGAEYDAIDAEGSLLLGGLKTGKSLYKHVSAAGMYYGDVSDDEPAVIERITIKSSEKRNFATGLYAPAGEVVKIEISPESLAAAGGELNVIVGQVSHSNHYNNIWAERNDFSRMPRVDDRFKITSNVGYVGNPLGGPIYVYPKNYGESFTFTASGAVKYFRYVHGVTTEEEVEAMKNLSAPYYDFEVWDTGVRLSGPKKYGSFDYDNLVKCGDLWEKIVSTSRQVPCSANASIGVGYVFDCFVAAGAACAFQGGGSWVNAPCSWLGGALDYDAMTTGGFWGNIHEYNHLYQSYGMEPTKTNEVTNNATSLLSYALYTEISAARSLDDGTLRDWNRYTDPSRSLRETIAAAAKISPDESADAAGCRRSLNAYADIIHSFGTDAFTQAARAQKALGVDGWYEALSLVTDYNFTYYFEELLGQTLSSEVKAKYDTPDRITFVPVATVFQTGRNYFEGGKERFIKTVRPFEIAYGESVTLDFNERLIVPSGYSFTIKSASKPKSGEIKKTAENVYVYTPGKQADSGEIKLTVSLRGKYETRAVTLTVEFVQRHENKAKVTKYGYDGGKYNSVAEAVAADFAGYSSITEYKSGSTFVNGLKSGEIGVVEGKIYIEKSGEYAFCLRSARGNNTLYLSSDGENYEQVLSLDTDHGGFVLDGDNVVKRTLNAGDYLYFKEITLSRHYNDAFTELGAAYLGDPSPTMKTVPASVLYLRGGERDNSDFTSEEKYPRGYESEYVVAVSSSAAHTLVDANMPSWSDGEGVENIFNDDPTDYYHNNRNNFVSAQNPFVLVADVGEKSRFNRVKITSRTSGQYNLPCTFVLYGSADGENWFKAGEFTDLPLSGNSVSGFFEPTEFRYYKLEVTDTRSVGGGNKYVTIAQIEFSYAISGDELSPAALDYFAPENGGFERTRTIGSTFGHTVRGTGKIEYSFEGSGFVLFAVQEADCEVEITIDGKTEKAVISESDGEKTAYVAELGGGKHTLSVVVKSGEINVDSLLVRK